ncbi:GIY-YIG nuclease family protein [Candidatus Uhrbacteria bacterium]|nr:GIY-YIG nuclease family protein [Candidatus Uhrbacteria bacterium]
MFYVYVIKSERNGNTYVGYSNDLKRRFMEHNRGLSHSTKTGVPWTLVYYESYRSKADARYREDNLKKHAKAYGQLRGRIKNSLKP